MNLLINPIIYFESYIKNINEYYFMLKNSFKPLYLYY